MAPANLSTTDLPGFNGAHDSSAGACESTVPGPSPVTPSVVSLNALRQPYVQVATSSGFPLREVAFLNSRFLFGVLRTPHEGCWRCRNSHTRCDGGIACDRCVASKGDLSIPCRRGNVYDPVAEIPFLCRLPPAAKRPPQVQQLPPALQAGARLLSKTRRQLLNDRDSATTSGAGDRGIFWSIVNTKIPNINGINPFEEVGLKIFELPYDDLIMQIVWELGDNPGASELLAVGSVEDLVVLLETASLCESRFGPTDRKKRLVYNSIQLLLCCLEALRLPTHILVASATHTHCRLNSGCICPAFAGLTKYGVRYSKALTKSLFNKKRAEKSSWLLIFYSLCLQAYIRCALMTIEGRLHPSQASLLTAKYLAPAVDLFGQISMRKQGMLAQKIFNAKVNPSEYLRQAGAEVRDISSSWQEWSDVLRHVRRIFDVGIPTNSFTAITTTIYDRIGDDEASTSVLSSHRPEDDEDDAVSDIAPSVFSFGSRSMSVSTARSSYCSLNGSVCSSTVEEDEENPIFLNPHDLTPTVEVHDFMSSDALLAYLNRFLGAASGASVNVCWKWGLPEFILSEKSTKHLDLESEVVLVTSLGRGNHHARRRFYALTWLELVDQQLGLNPKIRAFLAKLTEQTTTWLEEIHDKGLVYLYPFGDQDDPMPVELQLSWSSVQVTLSPGMLDPLFGDLLWAVGCFCQAFRNSNPSQHKTCLSTVCWQVQHRPIEVVSNRNQAGESSHGSENTPVPEVPTFEIAMSFSETPLHTVDHGCWQKLFVGGGNLIDLGERSLGNMIGPDDEIGEGLETSFEMLVSLAAVEYPVSVNEGVVFVGYQTVLVPVAAGDNWAQFHLLTNDRPHGQINPYTMDLGSRLMMKDFRQFQGKRCFLGWCEFAQIHLGTTSLPAIVGYSGGREKEKSTVFDGFTVSSQIGVSEPLSALFGFEGNFKRRNNRVQFTSTGGYSKLLHDTAEELAAVYDARARRCWLVPKLSLLLHMSHAYALSRPRAHKDTVPYADGHVDAHDLVGLLEDHGDVLVLGKSQKDGLAFRQVLLGLNLNLLRAIGTTQNSTGSTLYGFEFMDVVNGPGRGSCMKVFDLSSPGKKWLAVVNVVDAVVVCAGIGDVITAVRPNSPSNEATATQNTTCPNNSPCNILAPDRDYMATTVSCLTRLARRGGDPLAGTRSAFRLPDNLAWHVMGDLFQHCPHGDGSGSDSSSGQESCWERQNMRQQIVSQRSPLKFFIGLTTTNQKKASQSVGEQELVRSDIPNTGGVVFG